MRRHPSIGRVIHFRVVEKLTEGEPPKLACRAAIITAVNSDGSVDLVYFSTGASFEQFGSHIPGNGIGISYRDPVDPNGGGTWHWPEWVEGE